MVYHPLHVCLVVVGVVVEQEEGALSRAPVRVGQVLEEPLVVGEVVLVDSSVCKYHGHGTAEAGDWRLEVAASPSMMSTICGVSSSARPPGMEVPSREQ